MYEVIPEKQANADGANHQLYPSTCALNSTAFVVTWEGWGDGGIGSMVHGTVFGQNGNNLTSELRLDDPATDLESNPSACALNSSTFVVAWESYGQDGDGRGVYARVFDDSGTSLTSEIPVNTYTLSHQECPFVCALNSSTFVVAWMSNGQDGNENGVYARVFDDSGTSLTSEIPVNTYTTSNQNAPSVCALNSSAFVVAWQSSEEDGDSYGIYARIFDVTGANLTNEILVNSHTTNGQFYPSTCALDSSTFVVAWMSYGQDGDGYGVYARVFDDTGTSLTNEFPVNTYTKNNQEVPSVCMLDPTTFVVVWESYGQDGDVSGMYTTVFDRTGAKLTGEFRVNTYTTSYQDNPSVCRIDSTTFVVAWQSYEQDSYGSGVFFKEFKYIDSSSSSPPIPGFEFVIVSLSFLGALVMIIFVRKIKTSFLGKKACHVIS